MIEVYKYEYGGSLICNGCHRTCKITDPPCDGMYAITLDNGNAVDLCDKCALQLANKLCDILGKTRIDPSSESYKAGYRNGYKEGFTLEKRNSELRKENEHLRRECAVLHHGQKQEAEDGKKERNEKV